MGLWCVGWHDLCFYSFFHFFCVVFFVDVVFCVGFWFVFCFWGGLVGLRFCFVGRVWVFFVFCFLGGGFGWGVVFCLKGDVLVVV